MSLIYQDLIPGGGHLSLRLRRGQSLSITDLEGGANLSFIAFNAEEKTERLNLPDTLKAQHTAHLTAGHCLYSDMGRVLLCVVADSLGWHDPIGGFSNASEVLQRFGAGNFQTLRNAMHRNARDSLLVELGKWGLSERDLTMTVNLFSKLQADESGALHFVAGHSKAGAQVTLYAPMDSLLVMTALQHPLDPEPRYAPRPLALEVHRGGHAEGLERCRTHCPENHRGLELTERWCA